MRYVEILSFTKLDNAQDFAFPTLSTEEARDGLLTNGASLHYKRLKASITKEKVISNSS